MARNLYRFYLYIIFVALIVFAVVVTSQLLGTLFEFTALRGYGAAPTQATLVQALVFAIVGWLISGVLGGLHYWLIRRDQRQDPAAGGSAIRSFFLNLTEGIGVLVAVPLIGFLVIGNWAYGYNGGASYPLGAALPTLLMVLGLEMERRRFPAHNNVALAFQRLHFFGVQLVLFSMLAGAFFFNGFRTLVDLVFFAGQGECHELYCQPRAQAAGLAVLLLWFFACWLIYALITSRDTSRLVRMILHGASLALGIGWLLAGVFIALEVGLSPLFHVSLSFNDVLGYNASHDFITPLTLGLIATIVYHLLLQDIIRRNLIRRATLLLTETTIAALLLASLFWWGCGSLLYNLLQTLAPSPTAPDAQGWITTLALLIPGLVYIPLDLVIRRRFALDPASALGPRRSLILALLAAGILALAIGGAVALYAWLTALLGSPLTNWPQLAHGGLASTIVGAALIAIYIWPLRAEHLLARQARVGQPPAPEQSPTQPVVEDILDELLAGRITRAEAAARIRSLQGTATLLFI